MPAPLRRLLASLAGCDLVVARGDPLPDVDFQCSLLSLRMMLGTDTPADIPASVPYIRAESRTSVLPGQGPLIGVVWAGAPRDASPALAAFDRRRSLPFSALAPILSMPKMRFVSLQKGRLADGETTPWYPTMRIFRQSSPGDWKGVIEEVVARLRRGLP